MSQKVSHLADCGSGKPVSPGPMFEGFRACPDTRVLPATSCIQTHGKLD